MRRRATRRPPPQRAAARTCTGCVVHTDTPCMPACSCRRNNVCSRRAGTTAIRWRRAPVRAIYSSSRLESPCVRVSQIVRVGAHASPHVEVGTVATSPILMTHVTSAKQMRGARAKNEQETGTAPGFLWGYRTQSCTSRIGTRTGILLPSDESGGALKLAAPQVLQHPDVATPSHEVPEYLAEDTGPE